MKKFSCFKCHSRCKAQCCGPTPISRRVWNKHQDKIQTEPYEILEIDQTDDIVPVTVELKCVFLKEDYTCAIYEDRPDVCKKFGNETHPLLVCPFQDKNGNMR
jgi:Fe-S-cluster containining protein